MHNTLDWALYWAGRGFRVFPIWPYGKRPTKAGWQHAATTDAEAVRAMWTDPDTRVVQSYNIGICTTGFVVADADVKEGRDGLNSYYAVGGHFETLTVQTPTGGYHCYFHGPDSKLSASKLGDGLDIRSHHGYVLAAGSVTKDGAYVIIADKPMAHVPPTLEGFLEPPNATRAHEETSVEYDTETAIANAAHWLTTQAPVAISGQGGNDTTYKVAAKLVRDFALTDVTAFALLSEHWNERCIPAWDGDELFAIVEHATQYAVGPLGAARPEATFGTVTILPPEEPPTPASVGVARGNALDPLAMRPRPWVAKGLILDGEVTLVSASGAGGKSTFAIVLAAHFAVGSSFGPWELAAPGVPICTVLYNAEDDLQEQSKKLYAACQHYRLDYNEVRQNVVFMTKEHKTLLLAACDRGGIVTPNVEDLDFLVNTTTSNYARLIVLDPLLNLHACNENDNNQMNKVLQIIERVARRANAGVLVFHHTSKDNGSDSRAGNANISRGASAIVNSTRVSLTMTRATENDMAAMHLKAADRFMYTRIDNAKANYLPPAEGAIAWFKWHGEKIVTGDVVGLVAAFDRNERTVHVNTALASVVRDAMMEANTGSMSLAQAAKALQRKDELYAKIHEKTLKDHIQRTIGQGIAIGNDRIVCEYDKLEGRAQWVLKLS